MGTVPETHVTVQSPDELKEGPEDPWREAGCWKADVGRRVEETGWLIYVYSLG